MNEPLVIGTVSINPGEVKRGEIPIPGDMYGDRRALPIVVYRGLEDGPRLWIAGASHGDEPEGAYSMMLLQKDPAMDPQKMKGLVVLVPAINVEALYGGTRGDPRDKFSYDMNRIYPGKPDGYPSERVAWAYHKVMVEHCDLHLNIHSGGDHSYLDTAYFAAETKESLELGSALGPDWDLSLVSGVGPGSPASVMGQLGKGALTLELGGWCRMLTTDLHSVGHRLKESYINVMRHYGIIPGEAQYPKEHLRGHQIALLANASGLFVGEDVELRKPMKKGTVVGRIYNLIGDEVEVLTAPEDGQIFGLRSKPMVIEGEWCCFYGVIDEVRENLVSNFS